MRLIAKVVGRRKPLFRVVTALSLYLCTVAVAEAQTEVIDPVEDVMTSAFFVGDNRVRGYAGDNRAIHRVSNDNAFGVGPETVYVQFSDLDFANFAPPVDAAILTMTSTDGMFGANASAADPFLVSAHAVDQDPLAAIIDDTNPGGTVDWFAFFDTNIVDANPQSVTAITEFGDVTFDVTEIVNDWLIGTNANFSLALTGKTDPQTGNGGSGFLHGFTNNTESPGATFLTITVASDLLGDVNCDGAVNLLDVGPFVDLLSSGDFNAKADMNEDGSVNLLDVGLFIDAIGGN